MGIRGNNWGWTHQMDFELDQPARQDSRRTLRMAALESTDGKLSRPVHGLRFPLAPHADRAGIQITVIGLPSKDQ